MAFRKKADALLAYQPDIVVVAECEHPDNLLFSPDTRRPTDILWFGKNRHKGLAVLSYSHFRFKVLDGHNQELQTIVPIAVTGAQGDFNLFAIWANNPNDKDGQYVEQVWKAIHHYDSLITNKRTVLLGDFNSNSIWDRKNRAGNHSNVVKVLESKGIVSLYHQHHGQSHGKEKHPTFYLYRHKNKPYHIDYCFASNDMAERVESIETGTHKAWKSFSDHVPIIVTFADL